jgi:hypothetical protein
VTSPGSTRTYAADVWGRHGNQLSAVGLSLPGFV